MNAHRLLAAAQRLQAIAQAGLTYSPNPYDHDRYEEVRAISAQLVAELTDEPIDKIIRVFASEIGYPTPKVDVRAVVLREGGEVLLVRESQDGDRWTLPGGWADVGYTPFETAAKEVREEAGLLVEPVRLPALFDKRKHEHPPQPWYVYKAFIQCTVTGGSLLDATLETSGASWFGESDLPSLDLSTDRTTASQLVTVRRLALDQGSAVLCD